MSKEIATFAAGCFWNVEEVFRKTPGVLDTMVGYTGGHLENPSYERVCSGNTGHAESVQITFDPDKVSYRELLKIFWENHDPTTKDRQGPDIGNQYRSAIFYHSEQQKKEALKQKQELSDSDVYNDPVVTEILPADNFHKAEEYHQRYLEKKGANT